MTCCAACACWGAAMRLRERQAFYDRKNGIVTIDDVHRALRGAEVAAKLAEERRQKAAKEATKGMPLADLAEVEVRR